MAKFKKKNTQGIVDLNQARLEEYEKSRPSVAASQKVPSPKREKKPSERSAEKQMPTINEKNKKIKPIGNVSEIKNKKKPFFNRDENGKLLLTRRNVIYGFWNIEFADESFEYSRIRRKMKRDSRLKRVIIDEQEE